MMARLSGKRAVVTGAGRGIGRAIAEAFLQEGAAVLLADIQPALVEEARSALAGSGTIETVVADVADPQSVTRMVEACVQAFGGLDVLVNNAGIGGVGKTLMELSLDEWEQIILVDLTSVFLCCQAAVPVMLQQGRGSIVNLASITGVQGTAGSVPYASAKAGVIGLTKSLARELARDRINVNAIAPGLIDTAMSRARGHEEASQAVLWPRIGTTEDIAMLALYLASDESEFVTGQVININGGAYM